MNGTTMSGRTRACRGILILLAALAGCQASPPRLKAAGPAAAPAEPQAPVDPSFDWHVLVVAPFGSVLKDVPLALHEVLLFRDETPGAAPPDEGGNATAPRPAAPRFLARAPDEYMLCFKQDRLSRIRAGVRLPEADAAAQFAAVCAGWLKDAAAAGPGTPADVPAGNTCEGRDGGIHFSARLEQEPATALSITLDGTPDP